MASFCPFLVGFLFPASPHWSHQGTVSVIDRSTVLVVHRIQLGHADCWSMGARRQSYRYAGLFLHLAWQEDPACEKQKFKNIISWSKSDTSTAHPQNKRPVIMTKRSVILSTNPVILSIVQLFLTHFPVVFDTVSSYYCPCTVLYTNRCMDVCETWLWMIIYHRRTWKTGQLSGITG